MTAREQYDSIQSGSVLIIDGSRCRVEHVDLDGGNHVAAVTVRRVRPAMGKLTRFTIGYSHYWIIRFPAEARS